MTLTRNRLIVGLVVIVLLIATSFGVYSLYLSGQCQHRNNITVYNYEDKDKAYGSIWVNSRCEIEYDVEEKDIVRYLEGKKESWEDGSHHYFFTAANRIAISAEGDIRSLSLGNQYAKDNQVFRVDRERSQVSSLGLEDVQFEIISGNASIEDEDFHYVMLSHLYEYEPFGDKYVFIHNDH